MFCFGLFSCFRRRSKSSDQPQFGPSTATPQSHTHPSSSFHEQAQRIAQIPVAGMQRDLGSSSFMRTYHPTHIRGPQAPGQAHFRDARRTDTSSTTNSTGDTLIGSSADMEKKGGYGQDFGKGAWQGKPNGTAYDRREELTEEDEEMWARMAM